MLLAAGDLADVRAGDTLVRLALISALAVFAAPVNRRPALPSRKRIEVWLPERPDRFALT